MLYDDDDQSVRHLNLPASDVIAEEPPADVLEAIRGYATARRERMGERWDADPYIAHDWLEMTTNLHATVGQVAGALQRL